MGFALVWIRNRVSRSLWFGEKHPSAASLKTQDEIDSMTWATESVQSLQAWHWADTAAGDARQVVTQGICVPGVGPEMGQSGWLHLASSLEKKWEGKEKRKVARLGIRPRRDSENSKGFPFSNLFTNIKLIWIQFKFEFWMFLVAK
jgi:hypothetical protein